MKRKQRKLKIIDKDKSYPLVDSVLYKLKSKGRMGKLLYSSPSELRALCDDGNYRCFTDCSAGKPRNIQTPKLELDRVHTRVASLLSRIETFDGLHSGRKGRSNISNAMAHIGSDRRVITVDVRSFFQSTTREMVFDFFRLRAKCQPDVADLLSRVLTYNGHVPTGSRVSMPLAYFANKKMFDEMAALASDAGATMTIYVDDLTFSGKALQRSFISKFHRIVTRYGHQLHPRKIRFYGASDVKIVTGAAIIGGKLAPRNKHLADLNRYMREWQSLSDPKASEDVAKKVYGRLNFMATIDRRYRDKAISFRKAAFR